jgi:chemotaxis protein MotB
MSRRRKRQDHVSHERWLVSYADFITLLFAFFVVLYASSQVDNKKVAEVSAAIQGAFQELGVFTGSAPGPVLRQESAPPAHPDEQDLPQLERLANSIHNGGLGGGYGPDVNRLRRDLEAALGEEIKKHEIQMRVTPEGLVVSLSEVGFFESGAANLLPGGQETLTRVAGVLNEKGFQVRVEGHTDNKPIHTSQFKSNWELSTARATEVVSLLIEKHGFNPGQISAAGYSEYHPIASNDTEEGRKANRRVDLIIVARTSHAQALNLQSGQ